MKLISFLRGTTTSFGILEGTRVIDAGLHLAGRFATLAEALPDIDALSVLAGKEADFSLADIVLLPPIPQSRRIICVGLNYKSHIAEGGRENPKFPMLFPRYPDSLVAHGQTMLRPNASEKFDFEGELAFVIGKPGRHIPAASALEHVAGYACFNDGSIRDYQRHTTQFLPGKNFAASGAFGPWLVTPDEMGPIGAQRLETRLNGETMQKATLDDLLFGVADLIAYMSTIWTVQPGDVVATGTTGGVGVFREPQVWMKPGDRIEVEISGLGVLSNMVGQEESLLF